MVFFKLAFYKFVLIFGPLCVKGVKKKGHYIKYVIHKCLSGEDLD